MVPQARLVFRYGVRADREATARDGWNPEQFRVLLDSFSLVGEIGLDDRGDNFAQQRSIFKEILTLVRDQPVLLSIHSSGATTEVVQHLLEEPPSGAILHWFNGDLHDITKSVELGAYFSANAAMPEEQIRQMPIERVLCETDFPARSPKARKPADVNAVEQLLSRAWKASVEEVRATTWSNLRTLSEASGAIERRDFCYSTPAMSSRRTATCALNALRPLVVREIHVVR
jgi:TatD DNase family protein